MSVQSPSVVDARLRLTHAYLQMLADQTGVDLLHVKGPAINRSLLTHDENGAVEERRSSDVDVLVRPEHVTRLVGALRDRGWERYLGFDEGSAFGHAMNLRETNLGLVDVHRSWPGFRIDPGAAFDKLWRRREPIHLAHVSCAVPDVDSQRLILLLHAARSGTARTADVDVCWTCADEGSRTRVRGLAAEFGAELALAAATGHLDDFAGDREYRLWRYFAEGGRGRFAEWAGRWSAATGLGGKARVLRSFVVVNPDLLRAEVDGVPTASDWIKAYADRITAAARDLNRLGRRWLRRRS